MDSSVIYLEYSGSRVAMYNQEAAHNSSSCHVLDNQQVIFWIFSMEMTD